MSLRKGDTPNPYRWTPQNHIFRLATSQEGYLEARPAATMTAVARQITNLSPFSLSFSPLYVPVCSNGKSATMAAHWVTLGWIRRLLNRYSCSCCGQQLAHRRQEGRHRPARHGYVHGAHLSSGSTGGPRRGGGIAVV